MLSFIRGPIHQITDDSVLIEAGGLGYEIFVPTNVSADLPEPGNELFLHLSFIIRENAQTLYGFSDIGQKKLFLVLLGVSGVGPKTALQLVGSLDLEALEDAVRNHDIALMCKVPGVGKKTAERLILEIRDKLPALTSREMAMNEELPDQAGGRLKKDAMSALVNLGYTQAVSQNALKKALKEDPEPANLPALITLALRQL
jgi:Holliday junction DNA helicase RuvA